MYVQVDAGGGDAADALSRLPGVTRVVEADRQATASSATKSKASTGTTSAATWRAPSSRTGWGLLELRPMRMSLEEIFLSLTTEDAGGRGPGRGPARGGGRCQCVTSLAIAQKELKSYFASPIAYIVIGLFALLYGYFFVVLQFAANRSPTNTVSRWPGEQMALPLGSGLLRDQMAGPFHLRRHIDPAAGEPLASRTPS